MRTTKVDSWWRKFAFAGGMILFLALFLKPCSTLQEGKDMPPDIRKWSAFSIYQQRAKPALANKQYAKAIEYFDYVLKKIDNEIAADAGKQELKDLKASALFLQAHAYEQMDPIEKLEDFVAAALGKYQTIASDLGTVAPKDPAYVENVVKQAEDKIKWKGVDVYLERLRPMLRTYLDRGDMKNEAELQKIYDVAWTRIGRDTPLGAAAIDGLLHMLSYNTDRKNNPYIAQMIRHFAGTMLSEVADARALSEVITLLNVREPETRHGSSYTLERITDKYKAASELLRDANRIEKKLAKLKPRTKLRADDKEFLKPMRDDLEAARQQAKTILHNLPETIDSKPVMDAIEKLLKSPVDPDVVTKTAHFLEIAGKANPDIQPPESLVEILSMILTQPREYLKKHNIHTLVNVHGLTPIRSQVATALGALKAKKAVPALNKVLEYEPEKDDKDEQGRPKPDDKRDWTNTKELRRGAAVALQDIGDIRAIPSLIKALEDLDSDVRKQAHETLRAISNERDYQYSFDRDFRLPYEEDIQRRKVAVESWANWWKEEEGIVILVERYLHFERLWVEYQPSLLFKKFRFDRHVDREIGDLKKQEDYAKMRELAEEGFADFQKEKEFHKKEFMDIGPTAYKHLVKYLPGRAPERLIQPYNFGEPDPALRLFIAETMAKFIETFGLKDEIPTVRGWAAGGDKNQQIGAIAILRSLPKSMLTQAEFDTLQSALQNAVRANDAEVATEALDALRQHEVLSAISIQTLTAAIGSSNTTIQIDGLNTLKAVMKTPGSLDNAETVRTLSKNVYDSKEYEIRTLSAELLGWVRLPAAEIRETYVAMIRARQMGRKTDIANIEKEWQKVLQRHPQGQALIDFTLDTYFALAKARSDEDREVRQAAAKAWKTLTRREHVLITDELAAYFLHATDDDLKKRPEISKDLVIMLRTIRSGGARAVADAGKSGPSAIAALRYVMTPHNKGLDPANRDANVRQAAAESLGDLKVRKYDVIEDLIHALLDASDAVRGSAYDSLKKVLEMKPQYGNNDPLRLKRKDGTEVEFDAVGVRIDTREPELGVFEGVGKEKFHEEWLNWLKKNARDYQ